MEENKIENNHEKENKYKKSIKFIALLIILIFTIGWPFFIIYEMNTKVLNEREVNKVINVVIDTKNKRKF